MSNDSLPTLLVVAAPIEGVAVARAFDVSENALPPRDWMVGRLSARFRLIRTGVGKVNAAAAVTRAIERARYAAVINLGIAGALPGSELEIGDGVVATESVLADEGILTPAGFQTCSEMGFPPGGGAFAGSEITGDPQLVAAFSRVIEGRALRPVRVATVSTCSGVDDLAAAVRDRTGAQAEAMEGAAIAQVVARFSDFFPSRAPVFVELRAISNTTGNRAAQRWDIRRALGTLSDIAAMVRERV